MDFCHKSFLFYTLATKYSFRVLDFSHKSLLIYILVTKLSYKNDPYLIQSLQITPNIILVDINKQEIKKKTHIIVCYAQGQMMWPMTWQQPLPRHHVYRLQLLVKKKQSMLPIVVKMVNYISIYIYNDFSFHYRWNKKLNYTIAISRDGVYDVTKRYTRKWHEVLSRRNLITESALPYVLKNITRECRKNMKISISTLDERDQNEAKELEKNLHSQENDTISLPGRLSGDKEWRTLRSELGSTSLSSSSCPIRKITDDHVSKIYDAFSPFISRLVELSSKHKAIEGVHFVRGVLIDLKKSPFKRRRVVIDSNEFFIRELLPSFEMMLDALSLKSNVEENGRKVEICLRDDPVRTSIALPVVFHAIDDVVFNIKKCDEFIKSSVSWPLVKVNRICCGSVLASGEELPFGIVSNLYFTFYF